MVSGLAASSTNAASRTTVTTKPVESTVALALGSEDVTLKVVPAGKVAPEGESVPVYTRVFPAVAGFMVRLLKQIEMGEGRRNSSNSRRIFSSLRRIRCSMVL